MFDELSQNSLSWNDNGLVLDGIERYLELNVDNMWLIFYVNVNYFTLLLNCYKRIQSRIIV